MLRSNLIAGNAYGSSTRPQLSRIHSDSVIPACPEQDRRISAHVRHRPPTMAWDRRRQVASRSREETKANRSGLRSSRFLSPARRSLWVRFMEGEHSTRTKIFRRPLDSAAGGRRPY